MSTVGLVALMACLCSVGARMFFNFRIRSLERIHAQEHIAYQKAQNELHQLTQKNTLLESELKHYEARRNTTQRNIRTIENTLRELTKRKQEDDAVRAYQKALIKGEKPK